MLLKTALLFLYFCQPLLALKCAKALPNGTLFHAVCTNGCYFPVHFTSPSESPMMSLSDPGGCLEDVGELSKECDLDPRNRSLLLCPCDMDLCNYEVLARGDDKSKKKKIDRFKKMLPARYKNLTATTTTAPTSTQATPSTETTPNTETTPSTQTPLSSSSSPEFTTTSPNQTTSTSSHDNPQVTFITAIVGIAILAFAIVIVFVLVMVLRYLRNRRRKLRLAAWLISSAQTSQAVHARQSNNRCRRNKYIQMTSTEGTTNCATGTMTSKSTTDAFEETTETGEATTGITDITGTTFDTCPRMTITTSEALYSDL